MGNIKAKKKKENIEGIKLISKRLKFRCIVVKRSNIFGRITSPIISNAKLKRNVFHGIISRFRAQFATTSFAERRKPRFNSFPRAN